MQATQVTIQDFKNEQFLDFSKEENKQAMLAALEKAKSEFGKEYDLIIDGKPVKSGQTFQSTNPSKKDEVLSVFQKATQKEVDMAMEAAWKAFDTWKKTPWEERAAILKKAADIMRERRLEIDAWMVLEAGKNWIEADADTCESIDFLEFYARMQFDTEVSPIPGEKNELRYIPLGVGAVIPPWNFPNAILTGMSAGPVMAGNCVLLKPASDTPTVGLKSIQCLLDAGLPPGVINFIPGSGGEVGDYIVANPRTRFINFTGSKEVGLHINELAAKHQEGQIWIKRVAAEMGGKDGIIVDDEADLDAAAAGVVTSAYGYQGQKCSACSRAIVVESVYDAFVEKVVEKAKEVQTADTREDPRMGPVINKGAYDKIMSYIEIGKKEGELLLGGTGDDSVGYFIQPTIFGNIEPSARLAQEEIFGPVLALIKAKDFDDALKIANGTMYGLTGAIYSNNPEKIERCKNEFHVGNLYVNRKCTGALVGGQPFGGYNMSGTCAKAGGKEYLLLFAQAKSISAKE